MSGLWRGCFLGFVALLVFPRVAAAQHCPHIGLATDCNVFIDIRADGSLRFQTTSQPPYDGIEDVLVGVTNHSGATVYGVSLTGNDIFGFDGDGPNPDGSYTGPDTSFTKIDDNSGTVNFNISTNKSGGLDDGQFRWFALEGAPSQLGLSHRIVIDAGHGVGCQANFGQSNGTQTPASFGFGETEHGLALLIATNLQALRQSLGDRVVLTRTSSDCVSIQERVRIANNERANIFVSIHFNCCGGASASGTETWYNPSKADAATLADDLLDIASAGFVRRSTKRSGIDCPWCPPPAGNGRIGVLRDTYMTGALAEVAFLDNLGDATMMHSATLEVPVIAFYMSKALDDFFNR